MPSNGSVLSNNAPPRTRSSIHSGLDVLECLAASDQPLSLTDIAAAVGMAKSSVHQLLQALDVRGYVQRLADQRYGVGVKAWELGCRATFVEVGRMAEPYMAELVRTVGEGAALAVLDGSHTVCIQIAESPQVVRVHRAVGERNPAHVVSNGLALLSALSDEEVIALLPRRLERLTPKTLGTRDEVLAELRRTRQRGYAVCRGTWRLDVGGVAVVVRGPDRRALAGVCISLPLERLTPTHLQRMSTALMATAAAIERTWGGPAAQSSQLRAPARPTTRRLAAA